MSSKLEDVSDEPRDDLLDALVMTSFDVMGVVTQVAARHDLSLTQLRALAILRDRQPRMSEFAEYLGLDRSTVSGLVDRAVARGLMERTADENDGRASRLQLTEEGHSLALFGAGEIRAGMSPVMEGLSGPEREQLVGLLLRLQPRRARWRPEIAPGIIGGVYGV